MMIGGSSGLVWMGLRAGGGSAPAVSSAETVGVAGNDVSIVTVDSTAGLIDADINGTSVPFVTLSATQLAVITSAQAAGTQTVGVTNGFGRGTGSITYHDPNDANTTLFLERGQYVGNTWIDQSATGANFSDGTGFPPETNKEPQFNDGVTNEILTSAATLNDVLGGTGGDTYSITVMMRARKLLAPNATAQVSTQVFGESGSYAALRVTDSWTRWMIFNGSSYAYVEIASALSLDEDHVVDIESNAGVARIRVDGGSWSSTSSIGAPSSLATVLSLANATFGPDPFYGDVRAVQVSKTARGDTWFDTNLAWLRSKHGAASTAGSEPEIDVADSDVFDPAGGDRIFVKGRNLTGASGYVGTTALTGVKVFGACPDADGIDDFLTGTTGVTDDTFFNAGAGSIAMFCEVDGFETNAAIFSDASNVIAVRLVTGGFQLYINDGVTNPTLNIPCTLKQKTFLQIKWDGSFMYGRVDGGPWLSTACAGPSLLGNGVNLFSDNAGTTNAKARVWRMATADTALADATFDSMLAGINYDFGTNLGGVAAASLDWTTLTLTGLWLEGTYTVGNWPDTASAGSSGSNDWIQGTSSQKPRVSDGEHLVATVPSRPASKVRGPMPLMRHPSGAQRFNVGVANNVLLGTSGFIYAVVHIDSLPATSGAAYGDGTLFTDPVNAETTFGITTSGITGCVYSGGSYVPVTGAVPSLKTWHLVAMRFNGTTLEVSLDGGTWSSTSCGSPDFLTTSSTCSIGRSYSALLFNGKVLEWGISTVAHSNSDLANIIAGVNGEYGLNIGGISPSTYDRAALSWSAFYRKYRRASSTLGYWTDVPSAGASGSNDAVMASGDPSFQDVFEGGDPLTIITSSGQVSLTDAIQYANPGTIANNVWWLRGDQGVTLNGSNNVTSWADQSGSGDANRNATPDPTTEPHWQSDPEYGGRGTIGPFNSAGYLKTGVWATTYAFPFTIGVVGHGPVGGGNNYYFTSQGGSDFEALVSSVTTNAPAAFNQTSSEIISDANDDATLKRSILVGVFDTAAVIYGNKSSGSGAFTAAGQLMGQSAKYVGTYSGNPAVGVERVAEIYAYSRALTLAEVRTLRRYRDSYYGKAA